MQKWLKNAEEVDDEDLERHDKWMCMMWPRLQLLKELLADDGVIFISIDHNELHHLRMLMDDIFGEQNFRNVISVRRGVKNVQAQFEYVDSLNAGWEMMLFYSKSPGMRFHHLTKQLEQRRDGSWNNHWRGTDRRNLRYAFMGITPPSGQWRWSESRSLAAVKNYNRMVEEVGSNPTDDNVEEWYFAQSPQTPDLIRMSSTGNPEHYIPPTDRKLIGSLWTDMIANESSNVIKELVGMFDNPKNTKLVKRIVEYICGGKKDSIILDSFAGSGTTAHAVLSLNKQDGGNRKFILVECEDYADTVTAERVRRVIRGIPTSRNFKEPLGGSFTYCTLGEPLDVNQMLTGGLPDYSTLAAHLLYTATGVSANKKLRQKNKDGLFHSTGDKDYYLLYKPDLKYMRSDKAMLDEKRAGSISGTGKKAVIFGAGKHMRQRDLARMGIEFCSIPDSIRRYGA